jgi:hypothetical protein
VNEQPRQRARGSFDWRCGQADDRARLPVRRPRGLTGRVVPSDLGRAADQRIMQDTAADVYPAAFQQQTVVPDLGRVLPGRHARRLRLVHDRAGRHPVDLGRAQVDLPLPAERRVIHRLTERDQVTSPLGPVAPRVEP